MSTPFPLSSSITIQELPGESPADITLSQDSVKENRKNLKVAELEAIDEDSTTTYTLIDGIGSVDNVSFRIVDDQLYAKESFDYEEQEEYSIRVASENSDGSRREEMLTISVRDIKRDNYSLDTLTGLRVGAKGSARAESSSGSYDSTSVNFINNTASGAFWVQSRDNRFEDFVLNPGRSKRITGSTTGRGNYDVNANIRVISFEPQRHSSYVGNMRFTNGLGILGGSYPTIESDGNSFLITKTIGKQRGGSLDGAFWYRFKSNPGYGNSETWRPKREGAEFFKTFEALGTKDPDGFLEDSVEFIHYYFGSVNGQKRWDFVATELPPV